MGRVAERHADHVVITSDNPRNEAPDKIIVAIAGGLEHPENATLLEDRATAIAWAIKEARSNDVVLIAGKGHENYQILGDERRDFSDFVTAKTTLASYAEAKE
jgi:UDP-N-acetylmuramoyl-L-alanyl-D-glutamate--2,6-diaminopimelate ligase